MNGRSPTKEEKEWMSKIRQIGCICCIADGHITPYSVPEEYTAIHHIEGQRKPDAHLLTIPLCSQHHQHGAIRVHGKKAAFIDRYGTERELLDRVREMVEASA